MDITSQNPSNLYIENYIPVVSQQNGLLTQLPVVVDNNLTVTGVVSGASLDLTGSTVATSGSTAATLGDTGGSTGPVTATQNSWLEVNVAGAKYFIPLWQ